MLLLLLAVPSASAWPESAAPGLRPDVVAAWHAPAEVQPHTQWQAFLQLAPGSNITAVQYQVCRVGEPACFAPPHPAARLANGTWTFDTKDYRAAGQPIDYQPGWRLGVKWLLREADATELVAFPAGTPLADAACRGDGAVACLETHYLAFQVAGSPASSPAASAAALLLVLAAAGVRRGRPA
ncbi:MAG: hypothetical protein QOD77_509 [Thermoplasmata archaeon]|nr:hypothetical protein [Thermoplasmata archaeon]